MIDLNFEPSRLSELQTPPNTCQTQVLPFIGAFENEYLCRYAYLQQFGPKI
ncbi:MAG: hypothetical protein HRT36_07845 [Alphaproteobacteria bacterium]|nr:hypothetical protein [Alphaproteobacteria bacterium]